ncbi:MAG: phosphoglycolate phosphatase [Rhizobiaceae bacterium]|nr:phosphoglycolate phosphatase [Rhizobiaceae bacterium]
MTRKTAVFDLDGTLIHTAPDLLDALNHSLASDGLAAVSQSGFGRALGSGGKAMIETAHRKQNRELTPEALERLYRLFLQHYSDNIPGKSQPYPGVLDALDRFDAAGYRLAICTNKTEAMAHKLIEGLGLRQRFGAICGVDTFMHCKPDPRHLLETIEMVSGDPSLSLMIGDSRTDIDTAKAAGIPVVAVDFGYTDEHVRAFEPSVIISHYDELTIHLADRLIAAGNGVGRP